MRVPYYLLAILCSVVILVLSVIGITQPSWIRFHTPASSPVKYEVRWGLFEKCTKTWSNPFNPDEDGSEIWNCRTFPRRAQDCSPSSIITKSPLSPNSDHNDEDPLGPDSFGFCEAWLTAGYSAQLSIVFGSAAILSHIVVMFGGRKKRERGWAICAALVGLHGITLLATTSFIAYLYNNSDRFWLGSRLSMSFIVCTIAWAADVFLVFILIVGGIHARKSHALSRSGRRSRASYQSIPDSHISTSSA